MWIDLQTMIWKEIKSYYTFGKGSRSLLARVLLVPLVIGILLPWEAGVEWLTTPISIGFWLFLPLILSSTTVADTFAGEKERHTLATLLASRLSNTAILFGKIGAAVLNAVILTLLVMFMALIPVNIRFWSGHIQFYEPQFFFLGLFLCIIIAALIASIGSLISLRAKTVKEAQQILSFSIMALYFIPLILINLLSDEKKALLRAFIEHVLSEGRFGNAVIVASCSIILLTVVFMLIALNRFKRTRVALS